jgi:hypothetical protein
MFNLPGVASLIALHQLITTTVLLNNTSERIGLRKK